MSGAAILTCVLIVIGRAADVTIGTLRTVFVVHGRRGIASVLGFCEVLIWIVVVSRVVQNLEQPLYAVAYALGFTLGTYLGITVEGWFGAGAQVIRVFSRKGAELAEALRAAGHVVTQFEGIGQQGPINLIFLQVQRRKMRSVVKQVLAIDGDCFYIVDDVRLSSGRKIRFQPPTGWRALFRKK